MRPVGRRSYHQLAHEVRELLSAIETLLSRIGYDVSLCRCFRSGTVADINLSALRVGRSGQYGGLASVRGLALGRPSSTREAWPLSADLT